MSFAMNQTTATKPETFMLSVDQLDNLPIEAKQALEQVDDLKYFLATAPANWQVDQIIRRYLLPTGEYVSCVLWRNLFHVTGTDIVRALTYRFQAFGRPVRNVKKFEEGIFSDLRNLKPGTDASLEEPKSAFLDLLYKNNCIRTQKKQKVFYWFSVPHDRLFLDALERDLKRERMGTESTTMAVQEPALSFVFDATQSLYEQLTKSLQHNAASEVGASLAAQQAQHNLMAAQYPGSMPPFTTNYSPQPGPSESYHRRSQSIQSAVPIDYRSHESQPPYHSQPPPGYELQRNDSFHLGRSLNTSSPATFQSYPVYSNEFDGGQPEDFMRQRTMSYDGAMQMPFPINEQGGISHMSQPPDNFHMSHGMMQAPSMEADFSNSSVDSYNPAMDASMQQESYMDDGFNVPYDVHGNMHNLKQEHHGFNSATASPHTRGVSLNLNMFEGSPTYKQRRRRQSIPASVLLAEQAAQAQSVERTRAATEPQSRDGPQHYPLDTNSMPPDVHYDSNLHFGGMNEDYELSYQSDLEIAELERCVSRAGSENDNGSPYSTKSYICPIPACSRQFKRLEHLKRHVRTHTQERPYLCDCCDKRFSRSDNLAQHRKTHDRPNSSSSQSGHDFQGSNFHHQQQQHHDAQYSTVNSSGYEDMSDYSNPEHYRQDEHQPSAFVPGSWSMDQAEPQEPQESQDMSRFSLAQQQYQSSEDDQFYDIDPRQFRASLNPPSPKTTGDDQRAADPNGSNTSLESGRSQSYIPSSGSPSIAHRTSAPRTLMDHENWIDNEATPRQDHFTRITPTFNQPNFNSGDEVREW